MTVKPRNNQSEPDQVATLMDDLMEKGWEIEITWDTDLKVWRAEGEWKKQKREGRGSTQLLALENLKLLTPSGT